MKWEKSLDIPSIECISTYRIDRNSLKQANLSLEKKSTNVVQADFCSSIRLEMANKMVEAIVFEISKNVRFFFPCIFPIILQHVTLTVIESFW